MMNIPGTGIKVEDVRSVKESQRGDVDRMLSIEVDPREHDNFMDELERAGIEPANVIQSEGKFYVLFSPQDNESYTKAMDVAGKLGMLESGRSHLKP